MSEPSQKYLHAITDPKTQRITLRSRDLSTLQIVSLKRDLSYANGWGGTMVGIGNVDAVMGWIGAEYLADWPGVSGLSPSQITDEPWMEGDVVGVDGYSQARKLTVNYALDYLDVAWPGNIPRPVYGMGTTLKLKVKSSGRWATYNGPAVQVLNSDGTPNTNSPTDQNTKINKYFALRDYTIEWDRVQNLDAMEFDPYISCVNSDSFLGCSPGTLLLESADVDPSFVLNPYNPYAYKATLVLKHQSNVDNNGNEHGWNDIYKANPGVWTTAALTNVGPAYPSVSFADLFYS